MTVVTKSESEYPRLTKKALAEHCREKKLYQTPELNDILYLHFKGYTKIENLEDYIGLKCIFLETNGIGAISGLDNQKELKSLYLSNNLIKKIENLDNNLKLDCLDLSRNLVSKIENLSHLTELTRLIISNNKLESLDDVIHLVECKSLTVLDLRNNHLEDPLSLDEVFAKMESLRVLYTQGNPFVRKIKYFRKTTIAKCKELTYLDDCPVFEADRKCAEAFARGGIEEERAMRKSINDQEHEKIMKSVNYLVKLKERNNSNDTDYETAEEDDDTFVSVQEPNEDQAHEFDQNEKLFEYEENKESEDLNTQEEQESIIRDEDMSPIKGDTRQKLNETLVTDILDPEEVDIFFSKPDTVSNSVFNGVLNSHLEKTNLISPCFLLDKEGENLKKKESQDTTIDCSSLIQEIDSGEKQRVLIEEI